MEERKYTKEEMKLLEIEEGFLWLSTAEDKLDEIFKYLPPVEEHKSVHSGTNAALINEACSILDSLFKYIIASDECGEMSNIGQYRRRIKRGHINMTDYRNLFESEWKLSRKKVFLMRNKKAYFPFLEFNDEDSPSWWKNYQLIKHNRFSSTKKATLDSTIQSVMAVFLIMCLSSTFRILLYRNKILKAGIPPEYWQEYDILEDKTSRLPLLYVSKNFLFTPTQTLQDKGFEEIHSEMVDAGMLRL